MVCERGMLRTVTVVKVEHEDEFSTRVFVESRLGDKFMWSMPYNPLWKEGMVLDMIVEVQMTDIHCIRCGCAWEDVSEIKSGMSLTCGLCGQAFIINFVPIGKREEVK